MYDRAPRKELLLASFALASVFTSCVICIPRGFADYGDCGQPVSDGAEPTASDALAILVFAIELPSSCESKPCICDVDYDGGATHVTTVDALIVLQRAVGQERLLSCCPP